jgi:hypothetical protein
MRAFAWTVRCACLSAGASVLAVRGAWLLARRRQEQQRSSHEGDTGQDAGGDAEDRCLGAWPDRTGAVAAGSRVIAATAPAEGGAAASPAAATGETTSASVGPQDPNGPPQSKPERAEPFSFADFTWLNGNARTKDVPLDTKFFTPEIRADVSYIYDFNHPKDDTIGGSSEVFRSDEVQVTQSAWAATSTTTMCEGA